MKWIKGIALFLVANFLIYLTLTFTANLLINVVLPAFGIDVRGAFNEQLLVWSLVIGFGGAFISLLFSKQMARAMLSNAQQITSPRSHAEQMIYGSVQDIARRLNITMPEVWVYEAEDPNAFATGPSKNNSMVAVSTGLLQNLKEDEVRAVLAHEMGHVYNGDMFTTTVLAGLMNTFVYYISNFLSSLVGQSGDREEGAAGNPSLGFIVYIVLQVVLSFMAMLVVSWHSRRREFGADAFSAKVYGKGAMISALQAINRWVNRAQVEYGTQDPLATFKISGKTSGVMHLFATHPPMEERIAALERL